jgi:hypothetical protein
MKILKPNEIGYGGLIENDAGFIDPTIDLNKTITEGFTIEQDQDIILYAVLQKADTENKNKRVYPYDILKKEVERYKKTINLKTALNELNHPESSIISLDKVSHQILDIWMEGKVVWGKLKILTSPGFKKYGYVGNYAPDIAANLLLHGINIGISSRGVGSVKKQGGVNIVQNDFELICFDLVHSPSTPGAYLMQDKGMERQFNESEEKKNNLLINKLDKFII